MADPPFLVDFGSYEVRVGFVSKEGVRLTKVFPSAVGYPERQERLFVGEELVVNKEKCQNTSVAFSNPIQYGFVTNWTEYEQVLSHGYESLSVEPESRGLLLCEPNLFPIRQQREKLAEIVFESLGVPSLLLAKQPVLQLFSAGRSSGIVCSSGHSLTQVVPVLEGRTVDHAVTSVCAGGKDLSSCLLQALQQGKQGDDLLKSLSLENFYHGCCVDKVKHSLRCAPAGDLGVETLQQQFRLPDGKLLKLDPECEISMVTDLLFKPYLDSKSGSFHQGMDLAINTNKSLSLCKTVGQLTGVDCIELCSHIFLAGGNTLFPEIKERFVKEIEEAKLLSSSSVRVSQCPGGSMCTWNGAAILGSLSTFAHESVPRRDFEEFGIQIVHKKFS